MRRENREDVYGQRRHYSMYGINVREERRGGEDGTKMLRKFDGSRYR